MGVTPAALIAFARRFGTGEQVVRQRTGRRAHALRAAAVPALPVPDRAEPGAGARARVVGHEAGLRPLHEGDDEPRRCRSRGRGGCWEVRTWPTTACGCAASCTPPRCGSPAAATRCRPTSWGSGPWACRPSPGPTRTCRSASRPRPRSVGSPPDGSRPPPPVLTKSQAARRGRVIRAALDLAAAGGYDAVQMRDVAARGGVALGTIYRYFPSKDALLLAVMVEWLADLERRVTRHPPPGATTVDRMMDVLDRASAAMDREPRLTDAVVGAMTAGDPASVDAIGEVTQALARVLAVGVPRRRRPRGRGLARPRRSATCGGRPRSPGPTAWAGWTGWRARSARPPGSSPPGSTDPADRAGSDTTTASPDRRPAMVPESPLTRGSGTIRRQAARRRFRGEERMRAALLRNTGDEKLEIRDDLELGRSARARSRSTSRPPASATPTSPA